MIRMLCNQKLMVDPLNFLPSVNCTFSRRIRSNKKGKRAHFCHTEAQAYESIGYGRHLIKKWYGKKTNRKKATEKMRQFSKQKATTTTTN